MITKLVLKNDEQAIETINKNFDKQQLIKQINNKEILEKHDEQYQTFKQRHLENYLFEKQIISQTQNQFASAQSKDNYASANNNLEQQKLNDPEYFPCRFKKSEIILNKTRNLSATQKDDYMTKLSRPRQQSFSQAFLHSHSDYKGLLIGELDIRKATQIDNCFVKSVLPSSVAQKSLQEQQQHIQNSMRPKTALSDLNLKRQTNYYKLKDLVLETKTLNDFNQEQKKEERNQMLEEMDNFEKKCKATKKGLGFAQSAFLEASNKKNSAELQKSREKKNMREVVTSDLNKFKGFSKGKK